MARDFPFGYRTGLLAVVVALANLQHSVLGVVPASVAVRKQSPEVEQIIQALEAKTMAADGTWKTRSGRQDSAADPWTMVFRGPQWSLQSMARAPSTSAGFAIYNDGENSYRLPDQVRFQNDTLSRGEFQDFQLGHELLLANFRPRAFLGALGNWTIVDVVTRDGVACTHLQVNSTRDPVLLADKDVNLRTMPLPRIDIYFDPERKTVVQWSITNFGGVRFETRVTSWDNFGTSASWPKTLVGKTLQGGSTNAKEMGKPCLLSVEHFEPREVTALDALQKVVANAGFFSAPLHDLRSEAFYKKAVEQGSVTASDRVALAQASFNNADIRVGLEQWSALEAQLPAVQDRQRLRTVLAPHAGYSLWEASKNKDQAGSCVALMQKLIQELPPETLRGIDVSIFGAWETLYTHAETRASVQAFNSQLMDHFIASGNGYVFGRMIALASKKEYAGLITPYLHKTATLPLPVGGYSGSSLSVLVGATLQANDPKTARSYLQNPVWDPKTPEDAKRIVPAVQTAIDQILALKSHQAAALAPAIESYALFASGAYAKDAVTAGAVIGQLLMAGVDHVSKAMASGDTAAQALLTSTAGLPSADKYWAAVIGGLLPDYSRTPQRLIVNLGPLFKLYGQVFKQPRYESGQWISLAGARSGYRAIQTQYLNKALTAAPDDSTRLRAIVGLAQAYAATREYALGAQAVAGASQFLKDPSLAEKAAKLRDSLEKAAASEQQRSLALDQEMEKKQATERLASVEKQLDNARKRGASPATIASLEQALERLQAGKK